MLAVIIQWIVVKIEMLRFGMQKMLYKIHSMTFKKSACVVLHAPMIPSPTQKPRQKKSPSVRLASICDLPLMNDVQINYYKSHSY